MGQLLMKICLMGDGAVGKTSLKERYMGDSFTSNYLQTIGADFAVKQIKMDGRSITFQLWDLAGQERFKSVRNLYYAGTHGGLLLFDVTRRDSFDNTRKWIDEFKMHVRKKGRPVFLIGNKIDLRKEGNDNHITEEEAVELAEELVTLLSDPSVAIPYFETSALTGENVTRVFEEMARTIIDIQL
ncbi:MAG: GTP-binding protein [Candidatus Odinarchaeota archaeon]